MSISRGVAIEVWGNEPAVRFAAKELARHLRQATGGPARVEAAGRDGGAAAAFRVGVCDAFGIARPAGLPDGDDWIAIRPSGRGYVLTGANPRSVLFAVYRYLRELGFRWIRPGTRGAVVPSLGSPLARGLAVDERPSCRYRTVCIEGACSERHVVDMIDWMAKQGMNGYFIQFDRGTEFWRRWYRHTNNPLLKPEPLSSRRVESIFARVLAEIRRRDLRLEQMGHGWTCAPLGVRAEGWDAAACRLPAAKRRWLAEIDGKREFFQGVPLNTNLCYSNPAVRAAVAGRVAEYARARPDVEAIHLWLADGANNQCECAACRKARPSDFYVELLNEVDARLAAAGLPTRVVFLIYVDLLWPPERQRLRNPDRFILMFAPITRSYLQAFGGAGADRGRVAPYARNRLVMPRSAADNVAHLRSWRRGFDGDGFDFDYHLIWACYFDPNQVTLARVLHQDIRNLAAIGLQGLNSCQNQRAAFPHNLVMDAMTRTLWNTRVPFGRIVRESFADAYGRDGDRVAAFFTRLSALWEPFFEPVFTPAPDPKRIALGLANIPRMARLAGEFRSVASRNRATGARAVRWSWRYLGIYLDLLDLLLPAFQAYLSASPDVRAAFERAEAFVRRAEKTLHPALDVFMCINVWNSRVAEAEGHIGAQRHGGQKEHRG